MVRSMIDVLNKPNDISNSNRSSSHLDGNLNNNSTYEAVYKVLLNLNRLTKPVTIGRITNQINIKKLLVKHELIQEADTKNTLSGRYLTYKYYQISPKGQEYLKRYESFRELLLSN